MNRVILMGRLTRDPEIRYSQGRALHDDCEVYAGSGPERTQEPGQRSGGRFY